MSDRVYNFSPGPAVLPLPVLERIQHEMLALPGAGASILELSHRGKPFQRILESAQSRLTSLLGIPSNYRILFLQGGSRLQFSMVPMNLMTSQDEPPQYIVTGSWGQKALEEARREGATHVAWDGKPENYSRVPADRELQFSGSAAYVHFTSNETIQGVQFPSEPDSAGAPLVCDASSDFLCRPIPVDKYGLIYACAQKNAGPAGVTIVIVRDDLLARSSDSLPGYLNYRRHADENSLFNTPCTFGIYVVDLVAQWLQEEIGGLEAIERRNRQKAQWLYEVIDRSGGFYSGHAQPEHRSIMNVTFRLPSAELEERFLREAAEQRLANLKGHRSVGGIRASIYNAMPEEGVAALRDFMQDFASRGG